MNRYRKLVAVLVAGVAIAANQYLGITEGEVMEMVNLIILAGGALGVERLKNEA